MNEQPIEKTVLTNLKTPLYDVHSIFYTIQGEGPFAGTPAVFIRLAGCNLQCPLCDTDYTSARTLMGARAVMERVKEQLVLTMPQKQRPLIVITGGEPFRQPIGHLVKRLINTGYRVQIETNGTLNQCLLDSAFLTIVCSPKTGKVNKLLASRIDAYKYVLNHKVVAKADGLPLWALDHPAAPLLARPPKFYKGTIYIQPEDSQDPATNAKNVEAAIKSAMLYGYIYCSQIHKTIGVA